MKIGEIADVLEDNNYAMNVLWQTRFKHYDAARLESMQEAVYLRNQSASQALAELNKLKKYQWISVEEKMPEDDCLYLVYVEDEIYSAICRYGEFYPLYDHISTRYNVTGLYDKRIPVELGRFETKPTHWMPLPEAPVASNNVINPTS